MTAELFNTWNPILHFDVLMGGVAPAIMQERTLGFVLEDNSRVYDQIEWTLDNSDGLLTNVGNLALGQLVRVRLGYIDATTTWKTFIITRMNGGVGAAGGDRRAVGSGESQITYYGRNRNAPDLRGKHNKGGGIPRPTGKGHGNYQLHKRGGTTQDVTSLDQLKRSMVRNPDELTRVYNVSKISDVAREIARELGYTDDKIFIQDTEDTRSMVVIPPGSSYDAFLRDAASELGWRLRVTEAGFHFHASNWSGLGKSEPLTLTYGGPDILSLTIDGDFRLPIPNKVSVRSHDPAMRRTNVATFGAAGNPIGGAEWFMRDPGGILGGMEDTPAADTGSTAAHTYRKNSSLYFSDVETTKAHLTSHETFAAPGAALALAGAKAQRVFLQRHLRALTLSLSLVGNPLVLAGRELRITGTGCPMVDTRWSVRQAKHSFSDTYITDVALEPVAQAGAGKSTLDRMTAISGAGKNATAVELHYKANDSINKRLEQAPGTGVQLKTK